MKLRSSKAKYILVCPSNGDSDLRHILDLSYGVMMLEKSGIAFDDIEIVIDGTNTGEINTSLASATKNKYKIYDSNDLLPLIGSIDDYENLMIIVTGHGSLDGIVGKTTIKAEPLFSSIRAKSNLKYAVIVLGQCYAGIFNYTDARAKHTEEKQSTPHLIVMGATNLYESISFSMKQQFLNGKEVSFLGNAFLIYLFDWLGNPKDVDGDGKITFTDAFKYAAARANGGNKSIKAKSYIFGLRAYGELQAAEAAIRLNPTDKNLHLKRASIAKKVEEELENRFIHQESWLLNAMKSSILEF